jgi:alkanesulfonate monooxygenase SsuD/methylene tetrahydromethanopterin reductase-like flavin-dependent oxidoreductase (luciferase family)
MTTPKFHAFCYCTVGSREELERGMIGKDGRLYQRMLKNLGEYVRICDDAGFAGFGHPEHHLQVEGMEVTGSPGLISMFIGQHSKRLKVNVFGYVVNTHNPLRVAEDIAMLDHMLQGRLNVAFVRGYQHRWFSNYAAVPGGVSAVGHWNKGEDADAVNRRAFEEAVTIIKTAWANDTFAYAGEFWNFPAHTKNPHQMDAYARYGEGIADDMTIEKIGIAPRPFQSPHPPLYAGFTHSMTSVRYWAREGGKPICLALNDELYNGMTRIYRDEAAQHGRIVEPGTEIALGGQLAITRSDAETDKILADAAWFWKTWGTPFGLGAPEMFVGDVDTVSRKIEYALEKLGTDELFFLIGDGLFPHDTVTHTLETLGNQVMPRFI